MSHNGTKARLFHCVINPHFTAVVYLLYDLHMEILFIIYLVVQYVLLPNNDVLSVLSQFYYGFLAFGALILLSLSGHWLVVILFL